MADQWYAIHKVADGTLVSTATVVAIPLDPSLAAIAIAGPQQAGQAWNPNTLQFEAVSVTKAAAAAAVIASYSEWLMWQTIQTEAANVPVPAQKGLTTMNALAQTSTDAVTTQITTVWNNLVAAVDAWQAAN
jgi:PHD/YefM family antitoxin component YafN of YafNO toxin-antitoxin module